MVRKSTQSRKLMLLAVFLLTAFGLVMLASISVPLSQQNFSESYYYFRHQLIFGFLFGLLLFFLVQKISPNFLKKLALPLFIAAVGLLLLVFSPQLGLATGGAQRWLKIFSFSFQPAELAKIALIIYLAAWLSRRHYRTAKISFFFSFLLIVGLIVLPILLQPDVGTALLIIAISGIMYFAAGARVKFIALVALMALIVFSSFILANPYRRARVVSFLNPSFDIQDSSYQLNQALITIGSGGLFGGGLGHSIQKYQFLPESIGDAIFAIIAEEIGFIGIAVVISLFLLFLLSGFKIAVGTRTNFDKLLVLGIISWLGLQTLINIGGISGLIPLTGIPLPFISYGGSALALELAAVGIVAGVARN